jgi:hypothetical protein
MKTMALSPEERRIFWADQIVRWRDSGLSRTAYCKQTNINLSQLVYWLKKEQSAVALPTSKPSAFIKVQSSSTNLTLPLSSDYAFCLVISDRISLHWQGEAKPSYIRELVKVFSE